MGIKEKIKSNFWGEYAISQYHSFMSWLAPKIIPDERAVKNYYKKWTGKELDLSNPVTFSQKQQWYKLNAKMPLMQKCADKLAVREYVKDCGYEELLNDLLGCYDNPNDIDIASLPNRFVIKASHGSGFNVIVKDKSQLNWKQTRLMLKSWMHQNIAWSGREWVYKDMPRHIIVEKYLEDETGELRDYKFFCFNGEPRFMQLELGRYTNHNTRNFYDMDWNLMPFGKSIPHNPTVVVPKPYMFDEMKRIAKVLCKPFQFVRVDLYQVGGRIYFGELTFFPAGGAPDFIPTEYDKIVGDMWKLEKNKQ
ncbi:ATP-grasp fold amidoligase family protein [Eubacterium sp.]|uniref:ATP-grasp fold amidoligase family protein n=1 Tax=Eubacterium sp. TaxID=142586 RepID=UPI003F025FCB